MARSKQQFIYDCEKSLFTTFMWDINQSRIQKPLTLLPTSKTSCAAENLIFASSWTQHPKWLRLIFFKITGQIPGKITLEDNKKQLRTEAMGIIMMFSFSHERRASFFSFISRCFCLEMIEFLPSLFLNVRSETLSQT